MATSLPTILQPGTLSEVYDRLKITNNRLTNFFTNGARDQQRGRNFAWDYHDSVQDVVAARKPGTGPSRNAPTPVGSVRGAFPRVHSSIPLLFEEIHNLRQLGGMEIDPAGENYITRQLQKQKQTYASHIEMQFAALARGKYYYTAVGDDLIPSLTSGTVTIDFQVPSGNVGNLNILGAGDIISALWSNTATDIPYQLNKINEAFEQTIGMPLEHVWIDGPTFQYVLNNSKVQALSGTANIVFESDVRDPVTKDRRVVVKGLPWLTWHITDGVLKLNGTVNKIIPAGRALFCPTPDPTWVNYLEGSEIVVEAPGASPTERFGTYFYAESTTKPAGYELTGVHNGIPALYVPGCIAYGTVS